MASEAVKLSRIAARQKSRQDLVDIIKTAAADPLIVGLAALAGNEIAYRSGLYAPKAGEKEESLLGGPVWISIGPQLPIEQQRRNMINGFIIGVTTAKALAPIMPAIIQGGLNAGKAMALVAGGI